MALLKLLTLEQNDIKLKNKCQFKLAVTKSNASSIPLVKLSLIVSLYWVGSFIDFINILKNEIKAR